ncbi:MAG: O-antigen ligase domain-containing protein [Parasphingorhabdus sp.]
MVQTDHYPHNSSERLVSTTIIATWLLWLIGGLYIAGPVIGCMLALQACYFYYVSPALPEAKRLRPPRYPVTIWLVAMGAMLGILIIGHLNFNLGTATTIKSSVGWAKGWMLIALFIFAGAILPIRPSIIYRSVCRMGQYTIFLLPIFLAAPFIGLPDTLWVSPLKIVGGSGSEYFATILYTLEPGSGAPRWQFFAPWSPAAGMMGLAYFLCALQEKDRRWKTWGIAGALAIILLSQSRLAFVGLLLIGPLPYLFQQITKPAIWFLALPTVLVLGWFAIDIFDAFSAAQTEFASARADSTRVRSTLGRIALERWEAEAYWFGHGIVERGPHLVEYMPIGSHHSWYGLLFVKGLLGMMALAMPMIISAIYLFREALMSSIGRIGFAIVALLTMYSFGENLESLAYLYWPALLLLGKALQSSSEIRG